MVEITIGRWHLPPQRGLVIVVLGAAHPLGALGAGHLGHGPELARSLVPAQRDVRSCRFLRKHQNLLTRKL